MRWIQLVAGALLVREGLRGDEAVAEDGTLVPSGSAVKTRLGYTLPDRTLDELMAQIRQGTVHQDGRLRPLPKLHYAKVRNIRERLGILRDIIREDAKTPETIMEARAVVSQRVRRQGRTEWAIAERDYEGEAAAVFNAMRDAGSAVGLRYVADPVEDDTFAHATAMRFAHGEDCDGGTSRGLALLRAIGFQTMLIAAAVGEEAPGVAARAENHVWGRVGLPKLAPIRWRAFDWSVDEPFGWEIPGIDEWLAARAPDPKIPVVRRIYKVTTVAI